MPRNEAHLIEVARVKEEEPDWNQMGPEERSSLNYSQEEKRVMYQARNDLRLLPPTGKHGGIITSIATELGLSRQYVHQVFFPKNPAKLFTGRAMNQKAAWLLLVKRVSNSAILPNLKKLIETLGSGKTAEVSIPASKFNWMHRVISELFPRVEVKADKTTVPTTYTLRNRK